jgi:hypothetical protein
MADRAQFLRQIMDSFELTELQSRKYWLRFSRRVDDFWTETDLYRELTEILLGHVNSPRLISTEHPLRGTKDIKIGDVLRSKIEGKEQDETATCLLKARDLLSLAEPLLESHSISFLEHLLKSADVTDIPIGSLSLNELLRELPNKMDLAEKAMRSVKPGTRIFEVRFLPQEIRLELGYRKFPEGPLSYFRQHYTNRGLTRNQLKNKDQYLYKLLLKSQKIAEAIPSVASLKKVPHKYKDPLHYFRHQYYDRRISRTQLKNENSRLYQLLRQSGSLAEAIPQKNCIHRLKHRDLTQAILLLYHVFQGNARQAGQSMNLDRRLISRRWSAAGLPKRDIRKPAPSEEEYKRIVSAYETYRANAYRAAKHCGERQVEIIGIWRSAGLEIRKPGDTDRILGYCDS